MQVVKRFYAGMNLASDSFLLLWNNKKLLLYLLGLVGIYFLVQTVLSNMPLLGIPGDELSLIVTLQGLHYTIFELSRWFYSFAILLATFFYAFLLTFFNVALIKHTAAILHGATSVSVRKMLRESASEWKKILFWALIFTIISYGLHTIAYSAGFLSYGLSSISLSIVSFIALLWLLATYVVLPLIALQKYNVFAAIIRSMTIVRAIFVELLGAQFWIFLVLVLCFAPLMILMQIFGDKGILGLIHIFVSWILILLGYVILTVQMILKVLLYEKGKDALDRRGFWRVLFHR